MGYFGSNCTVPCYYPTFGMFCKQECPCDPSDCNHMYGCENDGKASQRGFFLGGGFRGWGVFGGGGRPK